MTNIDPGSGKNFVLKFDTKSMPDKSAPSIAAEFVIFNGDEVMQTVTFDMEAADSTEWVLHEASSTSEISRE